MDKCVDDQVWRNCDLPPQRRIYCLQSGQSCPHVLILLALLRSRCDGRVVTANTLPSGLSWKEARAFCCSSEPVCRNMTRMLIPDNFAVMAGLALHPGNRKTGSQKMALPLSRSRQIFRRPLFRVLARLHLGHTLCGAFTGHWDHFLVTSPLLVALIPGH